jgi:hypothetical protein
MEYFGYQDLVAISWFIIVLNVSKWHFKQDYGFINDLFEEFFWVSLPFLMFINEAKLQVSLIILLLITDHVIIIFSNVFR